MKAFIISLVVACVAATIGTTLYLNRQTPPLPPASAVVESSQPPTAPKPAAPQPIFAVANEAAPRLATNPAAKALPPTTPATGSKISPAVAALLAAKSAEEKHDLFQQLVKAGQLDAAIAELKQGAADNPNDPQFHITLGEAQLNKLRTLRAAGGADHNDIGILAMQADQNFEAALKIDPANWEAQFVKASALAGWPAELNRGPEVIQQLASLIDQQETMATQPQFAKAYVLLGSQYEKIGEPDKAAATWQLGLTKFPNDPALQKKISGR